MTIGTRGQDPVGPSVATSTTEILAANADRQWAIIVNDSDVVVYVAIGKDAEANKGIRLTAAGGSLTISKNDAVFSTEAVNGIHGGSGGKVVCAQEGQ